MLLFSYDIFAAQKSGGISRCMIEVASELTDLGFEWRLWAGRNNNLHLKEACLQYSFQRCVVEQSVDPKISRLKSGIVNETRFAQYAKSSAVQVIHRSYYPLLDLVGNHIPQVHTLHDMWDENGLQFGAFSLQSLLKKRALQRADVIVCISQATRDDLESTWPWTASRTVVIPHGVRRFTEELQPKPQAAPYLLFVGNRATRKNFSIVIRALRDPATRACQLICFGGGPFTPHELKLITSCGLEARVRQVDGDDTSLAAYYEHATALLYPSVYEGFGLPLLEAMCHRCPVVAAPLTSLPEIGGDACIYADAHRPDAWASAIERLLVDTSEREQYISKGLARAATFSWRSSTLAHINLYRQLAG